MNTSPVSIIEAPLFVGSGLKGTDQLPGALLDEGLAQALAGQVVPGPDPMNWNEPIDAANATAAYAMVRDYSLQLADVVEDVLISGGFPVILGGDCTVLLGCGAAACRQDVAGLLFLDGHTDFSEPGDPDYETAGMDLAIVTGRGPRELVDLHRAGGSFRDRNVVIFGYRDDDYVAEFGGGDPRVTDITCISLDAIRARGFGNMGRKALRHFQASGERFWIHLDLDVLDDGVISAVDYRQPGGLAVGEVVEILRRALATGQAAGLDVTILNPTLDWDGSQTRLVVQMLERAFASVNGRDCRQGG